MPEFKFSQGPYEFTYRLHIARRKSIMLRVMPDMSLLIKAPPSVSHEFICNFILKKAQWIKAQQAIIFNKVEITNNRYEPGSTCYYLGKAYTLEPIAAEYDAIVLKSNNMVLHYTHLDSKILALKNWYHNQAKDLFAQRLEACYNSMQHLAIPFPKTIKIRSLKSRWGSCSSKHNISLNVELIQYPLDCIDYVIFHELCHLKELNHSQRFYALMDQVMADWQIQRQTLRKLQHLMPGLP